MCEIQLFICKCVSRPPSTHTFPVIHQPNLTATIIHNSSVNSMSACRPFDSRSPLAGAILGHAFRPEARLSQSRVRIQTRKGHDDGGAVKPWCTATATSHSSTPQVVAVQPHLNATTPPRPQKAARAAFTKQPQPQLELQQQPCASVSPSMCRRSSGSEGV